ncbi:acetate uptake transporter [Flavobacterium piscisymbiosum]|uniref:Acetate uptake transporter n=1 Tax=Flavobacterium piscisymbiosum TaxID=2893753 RepID=A0ABS8MLT4_9FLAO|nr:acetate uptake transporter [Flavobacterium sp. F-30]MCC9065857.1 acetate uptake transporter [Flavobacterium sp. F-30]
MEKQLANSAPLGLLGFGMTTILLNIHNMGFFPVSAVIISMGIFYGGIAQVIAGIIAFKRGNVFAATAFTSYGFFWITLVAIWMLPSSDITVAGPTPESFLGWYLALWGIFTAFMWYGTWGGSKVQQFIFLSLTVLFFLLAIEKWTEIESIATFAGAIGIICGSSAFYLAMAELLEEVKGEKVLPY